MDVTMETIVTMETMRYRRQWGRQQSW